MDDNERAKADLQAAADDKTKQLAELSGHIAEMRVMLQQKDGERQRCEDELQRVKDELADAVKQVKERHTQTHNHTTTKPKL